MSERISHQSRALIDVAGDPPGPSNAARVRMKRHLAAHAAILASTGAAAGATGVAGSAATGMSLATKLMITALLVVGGAGGAALWRVRSTHAHTNAAQHGVLPMTQAA